MGHINLPVQVMHASAGSVVLFRLVLTTDPGDGVGDHEQHDRARTHTCASGPPGCGGWEKLTAWPLAPELGSHGAKPAVRARIGPRLV